MRWPRSRSTRAARTGRGAGPVPALRGPRRDRHGRGVRGPLVWPSAPASASRSQLFDDCVLDAVDRIGPKTQGRIDDIEFAVQLVPELAGRSPVSVPLADSYVAGGAARVVLYRRPIEARATTETELVELVGSVVTEQVAALLFLDPYDLDDRYEPGDGA